MRTPIPLAILFLTGCGGPSASPSPGGGRPGVTAQSLGTLAGHRFDVVDAVYLAQMPGRDPLNEPEDTLLMLGDQPGLCDTLKYRASGGAPMPGPVSFLSIGVFLEEGQIAAPATFALTVTDKYFAVGNASAGPLCAPTYQADATAGLVQFDLAEDHPGGHAKGNLMVQFPDGELAGDFDATFCDVKFPLVAPCQ